MVCGNNDISDTEFIIGAKNDNGTMKIFIQKKLLTRKNLMKRDVVGGIGGKREREGRGERGTGGERECGEEDSNREREKKITRA
jgi:hypothetical protein